jgi:hypothetical protein
MGPTAFVFDAPERTRLLREVAGDPHVRLGFAARERV